METRFSEKHELIRSTTIGGRIGASVRDPSHMPLFLAWTSEDTTIPADRRASETNMTPCLAPPASTPPPTFTMCTSRTPSPENTSMCWNADCLM